MDPVTAFGLVEFTSLVGASSESLLSKTYQREWEEASTAFDLSVSAFFDCGVPLFNVLLSSSSFPQMSSRLLYDATILVAPYMTLLKEFTEPSTLAMSHATPTSSDEASKSVYPGTSTSNSSSPIVDWSKSQMHVNLATFANTIVLPFLQVPTLYGSMASLVRGSAVSGELTPPPLISLIAAQYALCSQVDASAERFNVATSSSTSLPSAAISAASAFSYGSSGLEDWQSVYGAPQAAHSAAKPMYPDLEPLVTSQLSGASASTTPRAASVLAFWLKTLLLVKEWYKIEKVLATVEWVFQLLCASGNHDMAVDICSQAEQFEATAVAGKRASVGPNGATQLPTLLTALLGSIAVSRGFLSNLFTSQKADEVPYPWTTICFMQSWAKTLNLADIGLLATTTVAPGQSAPMSLPALKNALAPLQALFEAVTRSLLVVDFSHAATPLYWNLFANLYFANCQTQGGQTLFFGHMLFQTSPSKSRREKVKSRLLLLINHYVSASTPTNDPQASTVANDADRPIKVQLRELFSSLNRWLSTDIYKFDSIPGLLNDMPMSNWLTPIVMGPALVTGNAGFAWASLCPRFVPLLDTHVNQWLRYILIPCHETVPVPFCFPESKNTIDLVDFLKIVGLERIESLRQLRQEKRAAHATNVTSSGEVALEPLEMAQPSSSNENGNYGVLGASQTINRSEYRAFRLEDDDFLEQMDAALNILKNEAISFYKRRQTHWAYLDRRLQLLQALKSNQDQLATAKVPCKLGDKCKGPAEFRVQVSRVMIDSTVQNEINSNAELLASLISVVTSRNAEVKANAVAIRFLRTLFAFFGGGDDISHNGKSLQGDVKWRPFEDKLIQVYWKLRDYHSSETTHYAPALQVFNLMERQLLQMVVTKNAQHVGRALYTMVEDPWASVALKEAWDSRAATPWERFHMLEYLWTQPLPQLSATSRATLVASFDVQAILTELDSNEARKDIMTRLIDLLKHQLLIRSNSVPTTAHVVDFARPVADPLFPVATAQLRTLACFDFPSNLGTVLQFVLDQSRQRYLHPAAWETVLNLPFAPSALHPGLAESKLQSILAFLHSYVDMFIRHHPNNHLAHWAPYLPNFLLLLQQIGFSLLHHIHHAQEPSVVLSSQEAQEIPVKVATATVKSSDEASSSSAASAAQSADSPRNTADEPAQSATSLTPSVSSETLHSATATPIMSPSASYSQLPIPARASTQDLGTNRPKPKAVTLKELETKILPSFFDLYSCWILKPASSASASVPSSPDVNGAKPTGSSAGAQIFESWDQSLEPTALLIVESLRQMMYYIIVGPEAFTVPSTTFDRRYNLEILRNSQLMQLFSPRSPRILTKTIDYLLKMVQIPNLPPQRASMLARGSFEILPLTLLVTFPPLYLAQLHTLQEVLVSVRHKPMLCRFVNRLVSSMVPAMLEDFKNPWLMTPALDASTLPIILNVALTAIANLPLPYEQEELDHWRRMMYLLPWYRLDPITLPSPPPLASLAPSPAAPRGTVQRLQGGPDQPIADLVSIASQLASPALPQATNRPVVPPMLLFNSGWDMSSASGTPSNLASSAGPSPSNSAVAVPTDPMSPMTRLMVAVWTLRTLMGCSSSPDPNRYPYLITIQGVLSNASPVPEDWQTTDNAVRMAKLISTVFALQAVLLPIAISYDDPHIWQHGGLLNQMLRYIVNVNGILQTGNNYTSSSGPLSPEVREYLQSQCQISPQVPDAYAYPALWTHLLTMMTKAAFSVFGTFGALSKAPLVSSSSNPAGTDTLSIWEQKFVEIAVAIHRDVSQWTPLFVSVILSSVPNMTAVAALLEQILYTDWVAFKSIPRLCDTLTLPPTESNFNFALLRQRLYKSNALVSLLVVASQALQQYHQHKQSDQSILGGAAATAPLLQLEPELAHWAATVLVVPGHEHEVLALWMKISHIYIELIVANAQSVENILSASSSAPGSSSASVRPLAASNSASSSVSATQGGTTAKKLDLLAQLLKVAKVAWAKSEAKVESDSSLLRMIGVKKSSPLSAPFRLGAQILSLFLHEHLLETPVLGPGNKPIGTFISLRNQNSYAIVDPAQDKRKQTLLENTKKPPLSTFAPAVSAAIAFISRPQKSLNDLIELWALIAPMFDLQTAALLQSLSAH
jgi:hypothetical protein